MPVGLMVTTDVPKGLLREGKATPEWLDEYDRQHLLGWSALAVLATVALEAVQRGDCPDADCPVCVATSKAVAWVAGEGAKYAPRDLDLQQAVDAVLGKEV